MTAATKTRRARAVIPTSAPERAAYGHAAGRHLVQDNENYAWPMANAGDYLDIDFDVRAYRGEGMYLLHLEPPADEVVGAPGRFPFSSRWTGVRPLCRHVGTVHGLHWFASGINGRGWQLVGEEQESRLQILGVVHDIYCSTLRHTQRGVAFTGRLTAMGEDSDGTAFLQFQPGEGRTLTLSGLADDEVRRLAPLMMDAMKLEVTS